MVTQAATLGWAIMAALFCLIELKTPGLFYFLSFALGAAGAGISAYNGCLPQDQMALFLGLSLVAFFFLRLCVGVVHKTIKNTKTNADALPGKHGVVVQTIAAHGVGRVRVEGAVWVALSECGKEIIKDMPITVVRVEGIRLIVR